MNGTVGYAIVNISALISFASCGLYFYFYHTRPEIRAVYGSKYAYILLYFDTFMSLATLLPTPMSDSDSLCAIQGFLFQFLPVSKSLWTALISGDLYWVIKHQRNGFSIPKYLSFVILTGLIIATLPFFLGGYSRSSYCSVSYVPLSLCTFYALVRVVQIWNIVLLRLFLKEYDKVNEGGTAVKDMRRRLKVYPLIIIVCYTPLTIIRLLDSLELDPTWGIYIGLFFFRLSGLVNLIIYGYTEEFKKALFPKKEEELGREFFVAIQQPQVGISLDIIR